MRTNANIGAAQVFARRASHTPGTWGGADLSGDQRSAGGTDAPTGTAVTAVAILVWSTLMSSLFRPAGLVVAMSMVSAAPAWAETFQFSTGNVTSQIGLASRPALDGKTEREAADDFVLAQATTLTGASFTGLLVGSGGPLSVGSIDIEIYRIFPNDSDVGRTSGAPTFSTPQVPTRVNSPSDVAFDTRSSSVDGNLSFSTTVLAASFSASNSVLNGINALPNQRTGGEGPITGQEVRFDIAFIDPLALPADHYFFVPQVQVIGGEFYWLSAARPIVPPGTAFAPDLQSWERGPNVDPDWLRVGTDIVGGTTPQTFNQAFALTGTSVAPVPEPETWALMLAGIAAAGAFARRGRPLSEPRRGG